MRSDRLKELREKFRYTQEELAEMLKRDIKQVWRWENGRNIPASDAVIELAKLFDVSADYLLGLSDVPRVELSERIPDLTNIEAELIQTLRNGDTIEAIMLIATFRDRWKK